jgi:UDP-N-acetylmuramate: L-alanyl-gamma-D-glutamyl-meso-diaminopimelate ligase
MQRVHFIAIGGAILHNMAIALSLKADYLVTGSDEEIPEPNYSRLKKHDLIPDKPGWFPDKIHKNLNAIILARDARNDNPELLKAKELGLKIYSFPEYLYLQTRNKTRIVVSGSYGKSTTAAMILYVLKKMRMDADYLVSKPIAGNENLVKLTYDSRIAVIEGEDNLTSDLFPSPRFHFYKPHIAILTGISSSQKTDRQDFENNIELYRQFIELMEIQGRLIYSGSDEELTKMAEKLRRDIVPFPYKTPAFEIIDGITFLITRKGKIALKISGEDNLRYLTAASLACRQIGITEERFNNLISEFTIAE